LTGKEMANGDLYSGQKKMRSALSLSMYFCLI
jgi:hypothetical protein